MHTTFYRAFEEKFRGSRETVKARLEVYLPFLRPFLNDKNPVTALDLGCGRGEWLELMRDNGISGQGVDLDESMLTACQNIGLSVLVEDAISFLKTMPNESLNIISAFHLIEHLSFSSVQELITESFRALKPAGLLILETPNPENIVVGSSLFYLDPTHVKPIPSQFLQFSVDFAGFWRSKIIRLQESPRLHNLEQEITLLNILNGVSPDYAVVAQKTGDLEFCQMFNTPFEKNYGVTLEYLANKYQLRHSAYAAGDFEATEARAKIAEASVKELLQSTSWRLTSPLRTVGGFARKWRSDGLASSPATQSLHLMPNIKWSPKVFDAISDNGLNSLREKQFYFSNHIDMDVGDGNQYFDDPRKTAYEYQEVGQALISQMDSRLDYMSRRVNDISKEFEHWKNITNDVGQLDRGCLEINIFGLRVSYKSHPRQNLTRREKRKITLIIRAKLLEGVNRILSRVTNLVLSSSLLTSLANRFLKYFPRTKKYIFNIALREGLIDDVSELGIKLDKGLMLKFSKFVSAKFVRSTAREASPIMMQRYAVHGGRDVSEIVSDRFDIFVDFDFIEGIRSNELTHAKKISSKDDVVMLHIVARHIFLALLRRYPSAVDELSLVKKMQNGIDLNSIVTSVKNSEEYKLVKARRNFDLY